MRRFAELYRRLDGTRRRSSKERALTEYFSEAPAEDAAHALHFLLGRRGRRAVNTTALRALAADLSELPPWLVEECHDVVGDLAETIALLVEGPARAVEDLPLHRVVEQRVHALAELEEPERLALVADTWTTLEPLSRMLYTKLVTGAFRVGVSSGLVARALATLAGTEPATMAHRLAGRWQPGAEAFEQLIAGDPAGGDPLRPYPFLLAHPVPADVRELGDAAAFQAEWKWDGIRAQAVRRGGERLLWSRGEELVDAGFPEVIEALEAVPDGTVLDGELLAWRADGPLPFHDLQRRIRRRSVGPKLRAEVPVRFLAYDLLEADGVDLRAAPLTERRARLEELLAAAGRPSLGLAPIVEGASWEELSALRDGARDRGVEGLMLKARDGAYGAGRVRGGWWKWKVDPLRLDTVLMAAQRGHGRRASLYTDYTLGVWDGDVLVPIAKAYSGLTDAELRRVDNFVRRNIVERFGPVRSVPPRHVFEIAFEGLQPSRRHKSGIALRFPRIARWREDKQPRDADTLAAVAELLEAQGTGGRP